jgi:hypothetical protein
MNIFKLSILVLVQTLIISSTQAKSTTDQSIFGFDYVISCEGYVDVLSSDYDDTDLYEGRTLYQGDKMKMNIRFTPLNRDRFSAYSGDVKVELVVDSKYMRKSITRNDLTASVKKSQQAPVLKRHLNTYVWNLSFKTVIKEKTYYSSISFKSSDKPTPESTEIKKLEMLNINPYYSNFRLLKPKCNFGTISTL